MTSRIHLGRTRGANTADLIVGLAAAAMAIVAAQTAFAGMTLVSVTAVDPENRPGVLCYEYNYTNDDARDYAIAAGIGAVMVEGGGVPDGEQWRFVSIPGDETRPGFALWFAGRDGRRLRPGETMEGLYLLSRAKAGPTPWGAVLRALGDSMGNQRAQQGMVLGPVGVSRMRQAVPPPLLNEGWNWISFPLVPRGEVGGFDPAMVLGSDLARLNVFRYHPVLKMFQAYPDDFQEVYVGRGYELYVRAGRIAPNYFGLQAPPDYEIPLLAEGWSLLGCPRNRPVPLAVVSVRNNATDQVRTAMADVEAEDPWLNWNWVLWDSVENQPQILRPDDEGDDFALRPWLGYWVWSNREDLTVIVP
jgi:hypothetical protein